MGELAPELEFDRIVLRTLERMERNYVKGRGVRLSAEELACLWEQFISGEAHDVMVQCRQALGLSQ